MRSLSTLAGRACAIGALGIVMAGAAWALPAAEEPTIDSADAGGTWTTIGVSENIIEASWLALRDSLIYALHRQGAGAGAAAADAAS